jgi:hypothetical protein
LTPESFTFRYRNVNAGSPDLSPGGEGAGRTRRRRYTIHLELESSSGEDGPAVPLWDVEDEAGPIAENGWSLNLPSFLETAAMLVREDFDAPHPSPFVPRRPTHLIRSRLRLIEHAPLSQTPVGFTRAFVTVAKEAVFKAQDELIRIEDYKLASKLDSKLFKVRELLESIDRDCQKADETP